MSADSENCLTEVSCKTTAGYGTGYLITPDLVLTACHVISDKLKAPLPPNLEIVVRTIAHFRKGVPYQGAKLIWPPPARWQELAELDIALLKITPDETTRAAARHVDLGDDGLPRDKELQVYFSGFPRLAANPKTEARDAKQIFGDVALMSGVKQNLIEISVNGKPAKSDEGWSGISGAAVFAQAQGQIIAVVNVKIVDGMVDFNAMRLDAAMRDQDFRDHVKTSLATIAAKTAVEFKLDLDRLVCLVDRDLQDGAFRTAFSKVLAKNQVRPLCCLIYGAIKHRPADLADRFSLVTIPDLRKLKPGTGSRFRPIAWPSRSIDLSANFESLRAQLWNMLCDQDGSEPPSDPAAFKERLSDESRPHFFVTALGPAQLTIESAALWSAWLIFLDSIAACELTRPPLHVFSVSDVTRAQIEDWLKHVPPTKVTVRHALDELGACQWFDFGEWIGQRVPKIVPELAAAAAELQDDLEGELEEIIGGQNDFTASDLKQVVRKVSKRGRKEKQGEGRTVAR
jgi:Trypsin-like peptidase domain